VVPDCRKEGNAPKVSVDRGAFLRFNARHSDAGVPPDARV
jgi:hypothetical protein